MKIGILRELVKEAIEASFKNKLAEIDISLSPEGFGEFSTTIPLKLAKILRMPPMELAEKIKENINKEYFKEISVAKPGYINFVLNRAVYKNLLFELESKRQNFFQEEKNGTSVQIEFVSANPTGPLHVGNGRGGIIGDVLANLLKLKGFEVQKEYYVNDAGKKMDLFGASILYFYTKKCGLDSKFPEEGYKGKYIEDIAEKILKEKGKNLLNLDEKRLLEIVREEGKLLMLSEIKTSLKNFGVVFDNFFFETSLYRSGKIEETLEIFKNSPYAYEKDGAIWFRSTQFGDDKDRVLLRSNGEPTYTLADAAYHRDKWERGFRKIIDVWGADHFGHIVPMKALIKGLGFPEDFLDIIIYQIVHLFENGKEVMMSKHTGTFVTLDELVNEVGKDAARFFFLLKSADSHLNFDLSLAKENSMNNPVYYIQYTYARLNSIIREAKERNINYKGITDVNLELLKEPEEINLLRKIAFIDEEISSATSEYSVHRIPFITLDFAQTVNSFYQKHKVLGSQMAEIPRLSLVNASIIVLSALFDIMGIEKKERM